MKGSVSIPLDFPKIPSFSPEISPDTAAIKGADRDAITAAITRRAPQNYQHGFQPSVKIWKNCKKFGALAKMLIYSMTPPIDCKNHGVVWIGNA
jgi:hypothetical protein